MNAAASLELTALALTIAAAATAITAARTGRHHLSWLALGIGASAIVCAVHGAILAIA